MQDMGDERVGQLTNDKSYSRYIGYQGRLAMMDATLKIKTTCSV